MGNSFHVVQVQLKTSVIKNDTDRRPKRKNNVPQYEDSYIASVGHPRIEFGGFGEYTVIITTSAIRLQHPVGNCMTFSHIAL